MDNIRENYQKSGKILTKAMQYALSLTEPGAKVLDIAEKAEELIREKGAQPAFPVNISINEIAAHYSPVIHDDLEIPDKSIVKIDLGVVVNGYITDAARTKIFSDKYIKLKKAAEKALRKALQDVKDGTSIYHIGDVVEQSIKEDGFKPITNLSGHSLAHFSLHDGISIPNYSTSRIRQKKTLVFKQGNAYAIEPFSTTGKGYVVNDEIDTIFRQHREVSTKSLSKITAEISKYMKKHFKHLPFSPRWLYNAGFPVEKIEYAMDELYDVDALQGYAVLKEASNAPVAQAEDTIFVEKNSRINLTREETKFVGN